MGLFPGQLLPHGYLDASPHRANVYILDLDHELQPSIYEGGPDPGLD